MRDCEHSKLYVTDFANQPVALEGCLFCERDEALTRLGEVQGQLDQVTLKHEVACNTITRMQDERERYRQVLEGYSDVLRGLASYVGNGGYNSMGLIDAKVAEQKIRDGIDTLVRVETGRREAAESRLEQLSWLLQRHVPINELPSWWEPRCETCRQVIRSPGVCACGLPEPERCLQPVPTMPDGEPQPCMRYAGHEGDCDEGGEARPSHEHDWVTRREGDIQYCRTCPEMRDAPAGEGRST